MAGKKVGEAEWILPGYDLTDRLRDAIPKLKTEAAGDLHKFVGLVADQFGEYVALDDGVNSEWVFEAAQEAVRSEWGDIDIRDLWNRQLQASSTEGSIQ